jgi:(2Fe-2S) ferredoxin
MHDERLPAIADALSIGRLQRHILLCAEQTTPRCSGYEDGVRSWRRLKARLKELGMSSAPPAWRGDTTVDVPPTAPGDGSVLRTKVDCLRICEQGPIAVVYPDGVWYRNVDEAAIDRIVDEHLVGGRVVEDLVFAVDRLDGGQA